jgi:hypothetical protein
MSVFQSFIDYVTTHDDDYSVARDRTGAFVDTDTQAKWKSWQASHKEAIAAAIAEFKLSERPKMLHAVAVQFVADNLKALVIERSEKTHYLMPSKALFLKAASLFLASDVGMSDATAYAAVDAEINTLCMKYVKENLK